MDSFDARESLEPWNGAAEPLFRAFEAAAEAGGLGDACSPGIEMGFEGVKWEQRSAADVSSIVAAARARLKHGPLPANLELHLMYPEPAQQPGVFLLIGAHHRRVSIGGHGTDALRAKRAYDAARTVLIEQALVPVEPEESRSAPAPDSIPASDATPSSTPPPPATRSDHGGIIVWMEAHPGVMGSSVLAAIIAAAAVVLAKVL